eukprot:jgi/Botrbrau1/1791/Bobra.0217s0045.2
MASHYSTPHGGYAAPPMEHTTQIDSQLRQFWQTQMSDIQKTSTDPAEFKNQNLPLTRIKKIMKSDEDVRMISAEAPLLFSKASEIFILELTLRAWSHAESNKRRTLQKNDIDSAITNTDIFDFLVDIVTTDNPAGAPGVEGAPNGAREAFQYPGQMPTMATMQSMNDMSGMPGAHLRHDPQHVEYGYAMPDGSLQIKVDVQDGDGNGTE